MCPTGSRVWMSGPQCCRYFKRFWSPWCVDVIRDQLWRLYLLLLLVCTMWTNCYYKLSLEVASPATIPSWWTASSETTNPIHFSLKLLWCFVTLTRKQLIQGMIDLQTLPASKGHLHSLTPPLHHDHVPCSSSRCHSLLWPRKGLPLYGLWLDWAHLGKTETPQVKVWSLDHLYTCPFANKEPCFQFQRTMAGVGILRGHHSACNKDCFIITQ